MTFDRGDIKTRAIALAAVCGCRSWVTHKGVAHTQLEIESQKSTVKR